MSGAIDREARARAANDAGRALRVAADVYAKAFDASLGASDDDQRRLQRRAAEERLEVAARRFVAETRPATIPAGALTRFSDYRLIVMRNHLEAAERGLERADSFARSEPGGLILADELHELEGRTRAAKDRIDAEITRRGIEGGGS